jgi:glycosyltransferase involved in cell wall biosynthesis
VRIAILDSHPIQYYVPWYRELSRLCELQVLYAHRQSSEGQARAGYGVAFEWDVDLSSGYKSRFLRNVAKDPGLHHFAGCDTPELFSLVRAERYDAVIATGWFLKTYWQAVAACRLARVPIVVRGDSQLATARSTALRVAKELVYPVLLRSFDGFLSVGTRNRAYLEHYRVPKDRIFHVPHNVGTEHFQRAHNVSDDERNALRAKLGADEERSRIVLQVGRLLALKRTPDLIEAVARLNQRSGTRWIVVIVGSGPEQAVVKARAEALGVPLRMLGFVNQSELPSLYAASDVLVLASDSETWGLVVNEAMAAGLPAVVSDAVGCVDDMIEEGLTGYSFPCGDVPAFAAALDRARDLRALPECQAALARKTVQHSPRTAAEAAVSAVHEMSKAR